MSPKLKPRLRTRRWLDSAGAPNMWLMKLLPRFRAWSSKLCRALRLKAREIGRGACNCTGEPSLGRADAACHVRALGCVMTTSAWGALSREVPNTLLKPKPSPICRDCDFWCAEARIWALSISVDRGVWLFANRDNGLPACIDGAVLVASEMFMSRVEKLVVGCENGEDSAAGREDSGGGDDWKGEGERCIKRW
jgi:hypothetical protein